MFSKELNLIAQGNLDHRLSFNTGDEFSELSQQFNEMTQSLIEKERLEKFFSASALKEIKESRESELKPGGEKIPATVVFSTFTDGMLNSSESINAVDSLDLFLGICDTICTKNNGAVDKVIGNTIMMVFRQADDKASHERIACNSALEIHRAMLNQNNSSLKCFTGISNGVVISGKIGSKSGKLDYTVIGDTVNMAARLKGIAENLDESAIIVPESLKITAAKYYRLKALQPVPIKGKRGKFKIYNLLEQIMVAAKNTNNKK